MPIRHVNLPLCAIQRTVSSRNKHKTLLLGCQNNHSCQKWNLTMGVFFFPHLLLNLATWFIHSTLLCASCKLIVSTHSTDQRENNEPLKLCGRWARENQGYVASQRYCAYKQADSKCSWIGKLQQRKQSMGSTAVMWLMPKNKPIYSFFCIQSCVRFKTMQHTGSVRKVMRLSGKMDLLIWSVQITKVLQDSLLGQRCTATDVILVLWRLPGSQSA